MADKSGPKPKLGPKRKHTLHVIGWIGVNRCYLDISIEEAKQRYMNAEGSSDMDDISVDTITFDDEFSAYDAW
jgi:hypothetical protein